MIDLFMVRDPVEEYSLLETSVSGLAILAIIPGIIRQMPKMGTPRRGKEKEKEKRTD